MELGEIKSPTCNKLRQLTIDWQMMKFYILSKLDWKMFTTSHPEVILMVEFV